MTDKDTTPTSDDSGTHDREVSATQLSLISFALDEAGRSLAHQQAELDRLRERAITQLGYATAISTFVLGSLLGTKPERDELFYILMIIATVFAGFAVVATSVVWRTVRDWRYKVGASFIVDSYANAPDFSAFSELAGYYDAARESNEVHLGRKRSEFRTATIASALLVAWLVASFWALG